VRGTVNPTSSGSSPDIRAKCISLKKTEFSCMSKEKDDAYTTAHLEYIENKTAQKIIKSMELKEHKDKQPLKRYIEGAIKRKN
jgi:hypothetical protein